MKRFLVLLLILLCGNAWASRLGPNTTPAERKRGATFSDKFESQSLIEENGGTAVGTPTFSINDGVTLNGTTDYVTYDLTGTEFDSDLVSIIFDFTPEFNWDIDTNYYLYDADAGGVQRFLVYKRNNTANNTLSVFLGNIEVAQVPSATYSAYWLQNQRNVLVISSSAITDLTNIWLNGTQILTNGAVAWTQGQPDTLTVGARFNGDGKFDGTIHSLKAFKSLLTAAEAQDYYDQTIYAYRNNSTGLWDLTFASHDPTAVLSLDVSGNGNDATLGDGVTPATYPTKIGSHRGYTFDGVNDYFSNMPALPVAFTVVWMNGDGNVTFENAAVTWTNIITSGNHTGDLLFLALFPFVLTDLQELDLEILLHKELNDV